MRNDPKVIAAYLGVEDEEVASRSGSRAWRCGGEERRGEPLLSVRGVKTYYGKIIALRGVDLDVHEGEIVTLIGANGAGKSTLMMTICGNPRAREGSITFDGERHHPPADARDHARWRSRRRRRAAASSRA